MQCNAMCCAVLCVGDLVLDFSVFQAEAEKIISVAAGSLMACVSDMMRECPPHTYMHT